MDNVVENSSDCASGCESGWTMYFANTSVSPYESMKTNRILDFNEKNKRKETDDEYDEEKKDLSLISDASSGPPHFLEENEDEEMYVNSYNYHAPTTEHGSVKKGGKFKKRIGKHCSKKKAFEQHPLLNDTASSALFNFSNNNNLAVTKKLDSAEKLVDISEGYSGTQFEEKRWL